MASYYKLSSTFKLVHLLNLFHVASSFIGNHNFISDQRCLQDYSLYWPTDISLPKHNNNDDYDNNNNNNKDIWDQIQSLFWEKEKCVEEQEWKKSFSKTILASWSTMTLTISIYLCCCQSHILPKSPDSGKTCFEMTVCIRQELYKHRVSFPKSPNLSSGKRKSQTVKPASHKQSMETTKLLACVFCK